MKYSIILKTSALKSLEKSPAAIKEKLWGVIELLETNPRPLGVRKLKNLQDGWRVRVGDYRIVYQIIDNELVIIVIAVGRRKDVYRSIGRQP